MTPTAYTPAVGARITALLATFKLPSASRELVRRFVAAGLDGSLPLLCEVLELEAGTHSRPLIQKERPISNTMQSPRACAPAIQRRDSHTSMSQVTAEGRPPAGGTSRGSVRRGEPARRTRGPNRLR